MVSATLVKPTLTDIYEQKCQELRATKQKVVDCDWIPATKVTSQSFKMELKMHSQRTLFLQLNTHLLLKQLYSTVFANEEKKNHLCKMNAGWTFGHYPPCKLLLLGFPEKRLRSKD